MRKLTTKEFIEKARAVHGDKYDYSKAEYKNNKQHVCIICPEHGDFWKIPGDHLSKKQGCPKCGAKNGGDVQRKTVDEFILEAKAVHGDKYDYSKVVYVNARTEVIIICPIHGEFTQVPCNHTSGHGCSKCGREKVGDVLRKTTDDFIKEAKEKHGDKYDYSKTMYKASEDKVVIICPEHGEFEQTPSNHLSGKGCPECKKINIAQKLTLSSEEHASAIMKINPDIEILGMIVNATTPVLCRCKICGHKWDSRPDNLKQGRGCPKCSQTGFLSHKEGKLYIMVDDLEVPTMMKVGVSIDAEKRKDQVIRSAKKAGAVFSDLHVIKTWEGTTDDMQALEKAMHKALSQYKINFPAKFDGCQEFFYYRPEVFELIEEHLKKLSEQ